MQAHPVRGNGSPSQRYERGSARRGGAPVRGLVGVALVSAALLGAPAAQAVEATWIGPDGGLWSVPDNWQCSIGCNPCLPDNTDQCQYDVRITVNGAVLDLPVTINTLEILTHLTIDDLVPETAASLRFVAEGGFFCPETLCGTGSLLIDDAETAEIVFEGISGVRGTQPTYVVSLPLIEGQGLIRGDGHIQQIIIRGTVRAIPTANGSTLTLDSTQVTDGVTLEGDPAAGEGLFEAVDGATLALVGSRRYRYGGAARLFARSSGGRLEIGARHEHGVIVLEAGGQAVLVASGVPGTPTELIGMTLAASGAGDESQRTYEVRDTVRLNDFIPDNGPAVPVTLDNVVLLADDLTNDSEPAAVELDDVTLTGDGVVRLADSQGAVLRLGVGLSDSVIDTPVRVEGFGRIEVTDLSNQAVVLGTVDANRPGLALVADSTQATRGFLAGGTWQASNGGVLNLTGQQVAFQHAFDHEGVPVQGVVRAVGTSGIRGAQPSQVILQGIHQDGIFQAVGGGIVTIAEPALLQRSVVEVQDGSSLAHVAGQPRIIDDFELTGVLVLDDFKDGSAATPLLAGAHVFSPEQPCGGVIRLSDPDGAFLKLGDGSDSTTIDSTICIEGFGTIGVTGSANRPNIAADITANSPGLGITIDSTGTSSTAGMKLRGTVRSGTGALVTLIGDRLFDYDDQGRVVADGGSVSVMSARHRDGTFQRTAAGGAFTIAADVTLEGMTLLPGPTPFELRGTVTMVLDGAFSGDIMLAPSDGNAQLRIGRGNYTRAAAGFAVGTDPRGLACADATGDGNADLFTVNYTTGTVSALLGRGDGLFDDGGQFPAGAFPMSAAGGDFNGDGRFDLAVVNEFDNTVSVLMGSPGDLFASPVVFSVGTRPHSVVAADFDADGDTDLAVANAGAASITVLLNNGAGAFTPQNPVGVGVAPEHIIAADIVGDAGPDLIVANSLSDSLTVLENVGGAFAVHSEVLVGDGPRGVAAGDFDGDGDTDIASANERSGDVSIVTNDAGTFAETARLTAGSAPHAIVAQDFTGDGAPDLAVANAGSDTITVLLSDGTGGFTTAQTLFAGDFPRVLLACDVNNDGIADLATANERSNNVSVMPGRGDGTFSDIGPGRILMPAASHRLTLGTGFDFLQFGLPEGPDDPEDVLIVGQGVIDSESTLNTIVFDATVDTEGGDFLLDATLSTSNEFVFNGHLLADDSPAPGGAGHTITLHAATRPDSAGLLETAGSGRIVIESPSLVEPMQAAFGGYRGSGTLEVREDVAPPDPDQPIVTFSGPVVLGEAGAGEIRFDPLATVEFGGDVDIEVRMDAGDPAPITWPDKVILSGGNALTGEFADLEVAGRYEDTCEANSGDPARLEIAELIVAEDAVVRLVDNFDNQIGAAEALFVDRLRLLPGAQINLQGQVLCYNQIVEGSADQIVDEQFIDCNDNGINDSNEIDSGQAPDCNANGIPDECDIADGTESDCNENGQPDSCDLAIGLSQDCNANNVPDECDIAEGTEQDCNGNLVPDTCDLASGTSQDCNTDDIPDECQLLGNDCNANGIPDECEDDCNFNNVPDDCDVDPDDPDGDGIVFDDCNRNGIPDVCTEFGDEPDCNENGIPDSCDIGTGTSDDCNLNGIPDECEGGTDCNANGVMDICEVGDTVPVFYVTGGINAGALLGYDPRADEPLGLIGLTGFQGLAGLTYDPGRATLFAAETGLGRLLRVSPADGTGVVVGPFGNGIADVRGLAYDPEEDVLYGIDAAGPRLVVIDPLTGTATPKPNVLGFDNLAGLAFDADTRTLYAVDSPSDANSRLVRVRVLTGSGTLARVLTTRNVVGLTWDRLSGDLYGVVHEASGGGRIVRINTATGGIVDLTGLLDNLQPQALASAEKPVALQDCNANGLPDACDIDSGTSSDLNGDGVPDECQDCNGNGVPDEQDLSGGAPDCNGNGIPDDCDVDPADPDGDGQTSPDCNSDGVPDECLPRFCDVVPDCTTDCNANGIADVCEVLDNPDNDCNSNGIPDECEAGDCDNDGRNDLCELRDGEQLDCNDNLIPDRCETINGQAEDCNGNFIPDDCEPDCNFNGIADSCDIRDGTSTDCNFNGIPDECDIASGTSSDSNFNGVPDDCEVDCNENGFFDFEDIREGRSEDCNNNAIPDECDISEGRSTDCNDAGQGNGIPDECEASFCDVVADCSQDCNANGVADHCDIDPADPDGNGQSSPDCNSNGIPDECDLADGRSADCDTNGIPDECDIADCPSNNPDCRDCNNNRVPDFCDIRDGTSTDEDGNGVPDDCQCLIAGDFDCDQDVDIVDFTVFANCFAGSGVPVPPGCLVADFDGDSDVDIVDFNTFASNYTGSQ